MNFQPELDLSFAEDFEESTSQSVHSEVRLLNGSLINFVTGEFWTNRQRQAHSLHEVSYRACFKPQLPQYFISRFANPNDLVYDPFAGRGTTLLQAALMGRSVVQNDVNPLSRILAEPRLDIPDLDSISERLEIIPFNQSQESDIDLSMFFHPETLQEILSIRKYLSDKRKENRLDNVDKWIAMVCTNRLTGHSPGFFSVYSFPPNAAVSAQAQIKINQKRNQEPTYRDTRKIILKKSKTLQSSLTPKDISNLKKVSLTAKFLTEPANHTPTIQSESVSLVITSPPFLNIVQYSDDNWMRCWFNEIDSELIGKKITMSKTIEEWLIEMEKVLVELFRVIKKGGLLAFEVGEIRNKEILLDEFIIPLGIKVGFYIDHVMINTQDFTKTSNMWGISNNRKGTNTNRIVVMKKQ